MFSRGGQDQMDEAMFYQPQMQEEFQQLTPTTFLQVYMGQPELLDEGDSDVAYKHITAISKLSLYSTILGVTANVQIKRLPLLSFLTRPFWLRSVIRLPVFCLPFFLAYSLQNTPFLGLNNMHAKYWKRISAFQKTGDIRHLDPSGTIMRRMSQNPPPM